MTAEKLLNEKYEGNSVWSDLRTHADVFYEPDVVEAMQEYAKLKCQQLLEIVAEKAKVENNCHGIYENEVATVLYTENEGSYFVSTESILNAVDLNEFIK